jgi:membrane dipeptidase
MRAWSAALGITGLILVVAAIVVPGIVERGQNKLLAHEGHAISDRARSLHTSLRVADLHADSLLWDRDLNRRSDYGHVDLPRLREGNVALQIFTAVTRSPKGQNYVSNRPDSDRITLLTIAQRWPVRTWGSPLQRALYQAERLKHFAADSQGALALAVDAGEVRDLLAKRDAQGKPIVAVLGIEGMHAVEGRMENLEALWQAGYRVFGLQHFFDNELGGSLHGTSKGGLSEFGRDVVRAIVARKGIVDVAHSSVAVVEDVLPLVGSRIIVSHTGLHGACSSPRNIPDALVKRVAAQGGLIGIGFWDGAICEATVDGIVASLMYGLQLVGEDHIALGSDFDGATTVPLDASELAILTQRLLDRGLSEAQIRKVMGENAVGFLQKHLVAP